MVSIDFGDFAGVNMQDPAGLGNAIFADFSTFNFSAGAESAQTVVIPNHVDPFQITAFVRAYSNNWAFNFPGDGTPADGSIVDRLEVWVPGASAGTFTYRVVIDGFTDFYPAIENALISHDLSPLYEGQSLQILGTQTHDDTLAGGNLADAIYGYGGNDVLIGNAGDDYLDGKSGKDTMSGGLGNDDYAVTTPGDVVNEADGQGIDLVITNINYTLPDFVEDIALLDTGGAINATGNGVDNFLEGNIAGNRLLGVAGADTLSGLEGNDTLDGGDGADRLQGGSGADNLRGGNGADTLVWTSTDFRANGGSGTDTLALGVGPLNLLKISSNRIVDIERIDLSDHGANRLTLGVQDVVDISSTTNTLKIMGESADTVQLAASFVEMGESGGFTRYRSGLATVLIDSDIHVI